MNEFFYRTRGFYDTTNEIQLSSEGSLNTECCVEQCG
jgi:hypothetical protein